MTYKPTGHDNALPRCEAAGCDKQVSRPGYTLCYEHWRTAKTNPQQPRKSGVVDNAPQSTSLLSSTHLGEKLGISGQKINQVLAELGWIQREKKGWIPTEQGLKLCAKSKEHHLTGTPFVLWPKAILSSRFLINVVKELKGEDVAVKPNENNNTEGLGGFREKFPPPYQTTDGHRVRSKSEVMIDNWLYMQGLIHAYERQLPVEEEVYCDFYIPLGNKVYIEYWGLEDDPKYAKRKAVKQEIYKKYNYNLIELDDRHIQNLDDCLPKMLLKFNVPVD
jgi:hypothetical protein